MTLKNYLHSMVAKHIRKGLGGKLGALVGVEDLRRNESRQRFFQRFQTERKVLVGLLRPRLPNEYVVSETW